MDHDDPIFQFDRLCDDPRYDGFYTSSFEQFKALREVTETLPLRRDIRTVPIRRIAETWVAPRVKGKVTKAQDYPCITLIMPTFSPRAVEVLGSLLSENGELLPVTTDQGEYYYFNTTTVADILDEEKSEYHRSSDSGMIYGIKAHVFKPGSKVPGIFRIPIKPRDLYVNAEFARRVREHGLGGMLVTRVYPLPEGVLWTDLRRQQDERIKRRGVPAGRDVGGETVVIQLALGKKTSSGTPTEKRRVDHLLDELEDVLLGLNADGSKVVGRVEGTDFGVKGECRVFVSCSDARAMFQGIRVWIGREMRWEGKVRVVLRFGSFMEVAAVEEDVTGEIGSEAGDV